jgi:selenide,water dikinase
MPGGTQRNWESYGHKIEGISEAQKVILADPQTSGGLLVSVDKDHATEFESFCKSKGHQLRSIGTLVSKKALTIYVK